MLLNSIKSYMNVQSRLIIVMGDTIEDNCYMNCTDKRLRINFLGLFYV